MCCRLSDATVYESRRHQRVAWTRHVPDRLMSAGPIWCPLRAIPMVSEGESERSTRGLALDEFWWPIRGPVNGGTTRAI